VESAGDKVIYYRQWFTPVIRAFKNTGRISHDSAQHFQVEGDAPSSPVWCLLAAGLSFVKEAYALTETGDSLSETGNRLPQGGGGFSEGGDAMLPVGEGFRDGGRCFEEAGAHII